MSTTKSITREELIRLGLLVPATHYLRLPVGDPLRHAYEMRLILGRIELPSQQVQVLQPKENN